MDDEIAGFVGITGAKEEAARYVLEMCAGDLEQAIQLWYTDEELQRNLTNPAPAPSSSSRAPPPVPHASTRPPRAPIGHEDASGVIHIDSDDDDVDMDFIDDDDDVTDAAAVAARAQEEEDAAMAKRLQEELYGGGGGGSAGPAADDDGVRAPIARVTETLVAPGGGGPWADDDQDDMNAQILEQLRRRRAAPVSTPARPRNNPFSQPTIWDDPSATGHPGAAPPRPLSASGSQSQSRAQRLADLFRPPYDLMSPLSWDEAREQGKDEQKWLLVNLQDMTDFNCQALNRDIWKNPAVADLVRENFVFLQYARDDPQAEQYITFYFPGQSHENPSNYPHVSVVDPRTGEQVKVWSGLPFPSATDFHAQLAEFLDRYSLDPAAKNPVVKTKRPERVVDVDRMTEEEMLEMALKNSLAGTAANGGEASSGTPDVVDPDELTKSTGDVKGKGVAETESSAEPSQAESAFARIASDKPHVEPENDPATTTRIQFRHPTGRVIRRFNLGDTVERIYEWLKAEPPLEGKEGVPFELKSMPAGQDLIGDLDKTIGEAGLRQGTVMIEFVEE
ncbi:hypothetical protein CONLIGDRAFT_638721 [Coniochaeta ligniaria NRRL 30616]|uniref:UBX domain-containing protein n=1 Tax=Coniochaeta ligniaria NRRL 30616 TaxID=1408157 RepID=A0A1J7JY51_9PEZI|nr:hypothetical protein CONLIGDRAFT_638721 [Coniochaeta ligniaria NRRL 30616]